MNWDEYFISITEQVSKKSKDPSTKTGCVIVDSKYRPVSFGYNGFVAGCDETKMTDERPMRYYLIIHAEMNAIMFAKRDLEGCILYTLYAPCENCLKYILQSGIRKIIYKKPFVESKLKKIKESMTTSETDLAITRLLQSVPDAICKNINGKNYLDEIWEGREMPKF